MREPQIRCKCSACGFTQVVKVQEIVIGNPKCWRGMSLNRPHPCEGTLSYYTDDFQDSMLNAIAILQYLRNTKFENQRLGELVDTVADDLGHWAEGQQSPQEMGWVGQDGLP